MKDLVDDKFIEEDLENKKEGTLKFLKMAIDDPSILDRKDVYSIVRSCINDSKVELKKEQA